MTATTMEDAMARRDDDTAERELWSAAHDCREAQKDLRADMMDIKAAIKDYGEPVKAVCTSAAWIMSWRGAVIGLILYCLPYLMFFALVAVLTGNAEVLVRLAGLVAAG